MYNTHAQGKGFVILLEQEGWKKVQYKRGVSMEPDMFKICLEKRMDKTQTPKAWKKVMMLENKYRKKVVVSPQKKTCSRLTKSDEHEMTIVVC